MSQYVVPAISRVPNENRTDAMVGTFLVRDEAMEDGGIAVVSNAKPGLPFRLVHMAMLRGAVPDSRYTATDAPSNRKL
jgi:hypothetical protein